MLHDILHIYVKTSTIGSCLHRYVSAFPDADLADYSLRTSISNIHIHVLIG